MAGKGQWELDLGYYPHRSRPEEAQEAGQGRLDVVPQKVLQKFRMKRDTGQGLRQLWLTGQNISVLSRQIGSLLNLRTLSVAGNLLTSVPPEMCTLRRLERLDLAGNELEDLPDELSKLENLRELRLDSNKFSSLPESISRLRQLSQLSAQKNQLVEFPLNLRRLRNLTDLNLDDNQLSAESVRDAPWKDMARSLQVVSIAGKSQLYLTEFPSSILLLPDLELVRIGPLTFEPKKY